MRRTPETGWKPMLTLCLARVEPRQTHTNFRRCERDCPTNSWATQAKRLCLSDLFHCVNCAHIASFFCAPLNLIRKPAIDAASVHPEQPCGFGDVAAGLFEGALDQHLFRGVQIQRNRLRTRTCRHMGGSLPSRNNLQKMNMTALDRFAAAFDQRALDDILQFAHIPGKGIGLPAAPAPREQRPAGAFPSRLRRVEENG